MRPDTLKPAREASAKTATIDAPAVTTSERMREPRSPARGSSSVNSSSCASLIAHTAASIRASR